MPAWTATITKAPASRVNRSDRPPVLTDLRALSGVADLADPVIAVSAWIPVQVLLMVFLAK